MTKQIIKLNCAQCKKDFELEVQDCCSPKCAATRRESIKNKKRSDANNRKLVNIAQYLNSV